MTKTTGVLSIILGVVLSGTIVGILTYFFASGDCPEPDCSQCPTVQCDCSDVCEECEGSEEVTVERERFDRMGYIFTYDTTWNAMMRAAMLDEGDHVYMGLNQGLIDTSDKGSPAYGIYIEDINFATDSSGRDEYIEGFKTDYDSLTESEITSASGVRIQKIIGIGAPYGDVQIKMAHYYIPYETRSGDAHVFYVQSLKGYDAEVIKEIEEIVDSIHIKEPIL